MAVGLLGGTFDPVHNAHLAMAHAALEQLPLEKIVFIPTGPTRYRAPGVASAADRLAMLRLVLEPRFEIDERELAPGATGYTVDTLKALKLERPYLLIGADQYEKLDTWHRPDEIRRLSRVAVFVRPGFPRPANAEVVEMEPLDISSSNIRARARRGEDVSRLVPAAVANYIREKGLYR